MSTFKGCVTSVNKQFGYVTADEKNIHFYLFLENTNYNLPTVNSTLEVTDPLTLDITNKILVETSAVQFTNPEELSDEHKVFVKKLVELTSLKQTGMLDILKLEECYKHLSSNIAKFVLSGLDNVLTRIVEVFNEQCLAKPDPNNLLKDLKLCSLNKWLIKEKAICVKIRNWAYSMYNPEKYEYLVVFFTFDKKYKQFIVSNMQGSMLCLVTNVNFISLAKYLCKIVSIRDFTVITDAQDNRLVNYAIFDLKNVTVIDDSNEVAAPAKIFQKILVTEESMHTWFEFDNSVQSKAQLEIVDSADNLTLTQTTCYSKLPPKGINVIGIVRQKKKISHYRYKIMLEIKKGCTLDLMHDENRLLGIIPGMHVLVKNAYFESRNIFIKHPSTINLLNYLNTPKIYTVDLFHPWTSPYHIGLSIDHFPTSVYIRTKIHRFSVCTLMLEWVKNSNLPANKHFRNLLNFFCLFQVHDVSGITVFFTTRDLNLLRIILDFSEKRFQQWCECFESVEKYTWEYSHMEHYNWIGEQVIRPTNFHAGMSSIIRLHNTFCRKKLDVICKRYEANDRMWSCHEVTSLDP